MTIRGYSGYATLTSPEGFRREADTFTCGHCNTVVHIRPKTALEDLGGRCAVCDTLICGKCVKTGRCDPVEEKLKRVEKTNDFRRWFSEAK